jgi:hypothetical protein
LSFSRTIPPSFSNPASRSRHGLDAFDVSSVANGTDKASFTYADPPFKARKVEQIVASLTNQLNNERQHCDQGNEEAFVFGSRAMITPSSG